MCKERDVLVPVQPLEEGSQFCRQMEVKKVFGAFATLFKCAIGLRG